ncbi:transcription antiterminator [Streptococcus merionis]|uniref:BglG family transcription antiterminator n=1 Tax=Streptococcus merionis TaxID=400065 RepID=UPI0026EEF343|nr:PRD domain-containing protein [Streptococcus merionis]
MLHKKEWQLLQLLYEKADYQKSQQLADAMAVSERTVRKYLTGLEERIKPFGAALDYQYGLGVRLKIVEASIFQKQYQEWLDAKENFSDARGIEEGQERQYFLLKHLFFEEESVDLNQLRQAFHISKSSMNHLLAEIRQLLEPYQLRLLRAAPSIYQVSGDEAQKRRFISDYFLTINFKEVLRTDLKSRTLLRNVDLPFLSQVVLEECQKGALQISDFTLTNLLLHISLTIIRMQTGHALADVAEAEQLSKTTEYQVAQRILARLEEQLQLAFPVGETQNIALHLLAKSRQLSEDFSQTSPFSEDILAVLEDIDREELTSLSQDYLLLEALTAHMIPLQLRLRHGMRLENPLLEEIKEQYSEYFELTKRYFKSLSFLADTEVNDDEWAYITLHIIAAFDRQMSQKAIRTLVVCATGVGSAQVLRNRLEANFGQRLEIVECISYHELSDRHLQDIDLLISSIDISELMFSVPSVTVSVFLNAADIQAINRSIQTLAKRSVSTSQSHSQQDQQQLLEAFDYCFKPDHFLLIREKMTKEQLLTQMIACLDEVVTSQDIASFYQQCLAREQLCSTAFSEQMAFPHLMEAMSEKAQVIVACVPQGISWDNAHPEIRIVVLLSPSRHRNQELKIVSHQLAQWIDNDKIQASLLKEPSYTHFRQLFLNA